MAASAQSSTPQGTPVGPRTRSAGVLNEEEVAFCRANNIALAYDTAQIGWVPASAEDDIAGLMAQAKAGWNTQTGPESGQAPACSFRPWSETDLEVFQALLDDPEVWSYLPEDYPAPLTTEIAATLIELSNTSPHHTVRAILCDSDVVGQVRLEHQPRDADPATAEISYWLGRRYWGKGLASNAVHAFTTESFDSHPRTNAIIARVHQDNHPSRRVLEKAGYRLDGPDPKDQNWMIMRSSRP